MKAVRQKRGLSCVVWLLAWSAWATQAEPSAPPQVVFIPLPNAYSLAKHPSLPVLYVGCQGTMETSHLVTFRLNDDGSVISESKRVCDDYFSGDGQKPGFVYAIRRPAVHGEKKILFLSVYPDVAPYVTYANTNHQEFAAVALDDAGQPGKLLQLFRSNLTGQQGLMNIQCQPSLRRLFFLYYTTLAWIDLGEDGLPLPVPTRYFSNPRECWRLVFVDEWHRFFATRPDSKLVVGPLSADGKDVEFLQVASAATGDAHSGDLAVSRRHHKVYVLSSLAEKELAVYRVDYEGRLVGLPRLLALGPTIAMRCDFNAGLLYAFGKEQLQIYRLDNEGMPSASPEIYPWPHGEIRDVLVDERGGKVYVACSVPPSP